MRKLLYILTVFVFGTTCAQENKTSDCDLQLDNRLWKLKYGHAKSEEERIELIKQKIVSDSIYAQFKPKIKIAHSETIINQHVDESLNECGCKILFVLQYKKRRAIIVNLNERPELGAVVEELNSNNVKKITYAFEKETAQAIYGTNGRCGFVQMTVTDRKLKTLIKNVW